MMGLLDFLVVHLMQVGSETELKEKAQALSIKARDDANSFTIEVLTMLTERIDASFTKIRQDIKTIQRSVELMEYRVNHIDETSRTKNLDSTADIEKYKKEVSRLHSDLRFVEQKVQKIEKLPDFVSKLRESEVVIQFKDCGCELIWICNRCQDETPNIILSDPSSCPECFAWDSMKEKKCNCKMKNKQEKKKTVKK